MRTLVMKFGGTSVGMTTGLTQLLSIVLNEHERWDRLILVVSALEGVTDALLEAARLAQLANRRGYRRIVATLRTRHLALIEHLPLGVNERTALLADIDRLLFDMLDTCQALSDRPENTPRQEAIDAIIGVGERMAARIVAALLRQNDLRSVAIDGTEIVITDSIYGNATPNFPLTRARIDALLSPMLERRIIPVVTGFIASTATGKQTTLGRGGSDLTASVMAVCTDASEVWIWTDVEGLMSADPRDTDQARVVAQLSYTEAAELAYFGARLLHTRMIAPLQERKIPLRVRNIFKPQGGGTLVSDFVESVPALKAVTLINGLGMSCAQPGGIGRVIGTVDEAMFEVSGAHTDVIFSSQSSWQSFLAFVVPTSAGLDGLHSLELALDARAAQDEFLTRWTARPVTILTVVGTRVNELHELIAQVIASLAGIRLLALSQSPSNCSFSVVIDTTDAEDALERAHQVIVPQSTRISR
jgi:bifunctional aspartokinase / homoserine dehydrogenase 1